MTVLRALASALRAVLAALMAKGVISPGWYAILTGAAMLFVAYLLGSAVHDDRAALFVGLALGLTGVWSIERGIRSEVQRHRTS